jgi:hypothetical protein
MVFGTSAYGITIDAVSLSDFQNLIPSDVVGDGTDALVIGNGVQGVDGQLGWADANGVVEDDDDPIIVGDPFDLILGPCTENDVNYNPKAGEPTAVPDIDAWLITVTFDVSAGEALLPITLSETGGETATLVGGIGGNFYALSSLGFASGGGGDSFNPADNDLVGAYLIGDVDFNAGTGTDIGDFTLTVPGPWNDDYNGVYRIDLFGVDLDYQYMSGGGPRSGEIIAGASNSAGGYLVPEPGSFAIIGGVLAGIALKKRRSSRRS